MATLEALQDRLEKLRQTRASGRRRVSYDGTEVEYRTDAELAAAISDLERQIARASGQTPTRVFLFSTSKGLS